MRVERLVGLYVTDDDGYRKYREGMLPILEMFGGGFSYDFKVSEVLKSEVKEKINRVFIIYFKNEESMNLFFSNKDYVDIKEKYFVSSVSEVTEIAKYETK
ncbi:MAG: hypothetical protein ACI9TV_001868 [Sulfurimonas sp.]|jgi:uncharacterized protein (DUF1330 family)|uniref:DUF1330 domain-containing protein n=1 Tax=Sulfurimonas sp. TaxID=2022749 RepID=UPI0039E2A375